MILDPWRDRWSLEVYLPAIVARDDRLPGNRCERPLAGTRGALHQFLNLSSPFVREPDATTALWMKGVAAIVGQLSSRRCFSRATRSATSRVVNGADILTTTDRRSPPIPNTLRYAGTVRVSGAPAIPITGNDTGRSIRQPWRRTVGSRESETGNGGCAILQTTP